MNNPHNKRGFVYIIRSPLMHDLYKIGMTTNLSQRMKSLSYLGTGLICTIPTDDPRGLERQIHDKHAQYWQYREWFQLSDEILNALICSQSNGAANE